MTMGGAWTGEHSCTGTGSLNCPITPIFYMSAKAASGESVSSSFMPTEEVFLFLAHRQKEPPLSSAGQTQESVGHHRV